MKDENNLEHLLATGNQGPSVQIWRQHRDGSESYETLPEYLAELIVSEIRFNEPNTARAKIIRRKTELDYFLLADITRQALENAPLAPLPPNRPCHLSQPMLFPDRVVEAA